MEIEKPRHKGRGFGVWEGSVDGQSPAELVLDLAPLDAREGVVQMLGDLADLAIVYGVLLVLVAQLADGRDPGGGTGAQASSRVPFSMASASSSTLMRRSLTL